MTKEKTPRVHVLDELFLRTAGEKPETTLRLVSGQQQQQAQNAPDEVKQSDQQHPHGGGLGL